MRDTADEFFRNMIVLCFIGMVITALGIMHTPDDRFGQRGVRQVKAEAKPATKPVVLYRRDGDWLVELEAASKLGEKS
jgi:hypothetical protein